MTRKSPLRPELIAGLAMLVLFVSSPASAADPSPQETDDPRPELVLLASPAFGMESGIRTTNSVGRLLLSYRHAFLDPPHSEASIRPLGLLRRGLAALLLDMPLVWYETTFVHEVFGHGARGRAHGNQPWFEFRLPPPYSFLFPSDPEAPSHGAVTHAARTTDDPERDMGVTFGGIESNMFHAFLLNLDLARRDGELPYHDLAVYQLSKLNYHTSLFDPASAVDDDEDPDDVGQYVIDLQRRFNRSRPADRRRLTRHLRIAYLWNYLDPTFWGALYHTFVTYLVRGETHGSFPGISIGETWWYPGTRFNLGPFGPEHYLDLFGRWRDLTVALYGRLGLGPLPDHWGVGGRIEGLSPIPRLTLGATVDVWRQPQLLFGTRYVFDRPTGTGASLALLSRIQAPGPFSVIGKIAYKSRGYMMGQPLDRGLFGYGGLAIDFAPD